MQTLAKTASPEPTPYSPAPNGGMIRVVRPGMYFMLIWEAASNARLAKYSTRMMMHMKALSQHTPIVYRLPTSDNMFTKLDVTLAY